MAITPTCASGCEPNTSVALPVKVDAVPCCEPPVSAPITVTTDTCAATVDVDVSQVVQAVLASGTVIYTKKCPNETEFDTAILCDSVGGGQVVVVVTYSPAGIPTSTFYNLDGTPFTGDVGDLIVCSRDLESDQVEWCNNDADVTQWIIKENGVPTGTSYWTDAAGMVIPSPAAGPTLVRGACRLDDCDRTQVLQETVIGLDVDGFPAGPPQVQTRTYVCGVLTDTVYTNSVTGAVEPAPPTAVQLIPVRGDADPLLLEMCDEGTPFLRVIAMAPGMQLAYAATDMTADGTPYVASGNETQGACPKLEKTCMKAVNQDILTTVDFGDTIVNNTTVPMTFALDGAVNGGSLKVTPQVVDPLSGWKIAGPEGFDGLYLYSNDTGVFEYENAGRCEGVTNPHNFRLYIDSMAAGDELVLNVMPDRRHPEVQALIAQPNKLVVFTTAATQKWIEWDTPPAFLTIRYTRASAANHFVVFSQATMEIDGTVIYTAETQADGCTVRYFDRACVEVTDPLVIAKMRPCSEVCFPEPTIENSYEVVAGCITNGATKTNVLITYSIREGAIVGRLLTDIHGSPYVDQVNDVLSVGSCTTATSEIDRITETEVGCANGVPYDRITSKTIDNSTGAVLATTVAYRNSANVEVAVMPVGFTLGACPLPETREVCFTPTDPLLPRETLYQHFSRSSVTLAENILGVTATEQFLPAGYLNIATYKGGGTLALGDCPCCQKTGNLVPGSNFGEFSGQGMLAGPQVSFNNVSTVDTVRNIQLAPNCVLPVRVQATNTSLGNMVFYASGEVVFSGSTTWSVTISAPSGKPLSWQVAAAGYRNAANEKFRLEPTDTAAEEIFIAPGAGSVLTPAYVPGIPWRGYMVDLNTQSPHTFFRMPDTNVIKYTVDSSYGVICGATPILLTLPEVYLKDCGCCDETEALLGAIVDNTTPDPASKVKKSNAFASFQAFSNAGTTAAGLASVTITNVGSAPGILTAGTPLLPGETITYNAYFDEFTRTMRMVPSLTYDATGTIFHIATIL